MSALHDVIDKVEREVREETLGCELCIHMDPIAVGDRKTAECRTTVANLLAGIDPRLTMHDFRITSGPDHTNLIFDVVRPLDAGDSLRRAGGSDYAGGSSASPGSYYAVVTVDTPRI